MDENVEVTTAMTTECVECGCRVQELQLNGLNEDMREVKQRVERLETVLARGMLLLIANLGAVVLSLVEGLIQA